MKENDLDNLKKEFTERYNKILFEEEQQLDVKKEFDNILKRCEKIMKKETANIYIGILDEKNNLVFNHAAGIRKDEIIKIGRLKYGKGIMGAMVEEWFEPGKRNIPIPYISGDVKNDKFYVEWFEEINSKIAVPVSIGKELLGILSIEHTKKKHFNKDNMKLVETFAGAISYLVERLRFIERIRKEKTEFDNIIQKIIDRKTREEGLIPQITKVIAKGISSEWLNDVVAPTVKVEPSKHSGATEAVMYEAVVSTRLFVKLHFEDVPKANIGYNTLLKEWKEESKKHLIPPIELEVEGGGLLNITPFAEAFTLHRLVREYGDQFKTWILKLYDDFLETSARLWIKTVKEGKPDIQKQYISRIHQAAYKIEEHWGLPDILNTQMKVNNKLYIKYGDLLTYISTKLEKLEIPYSFTTHGDEHAGNILIPKDKFYDSASWFLIDYVNANNGSDWVFCIANMLIWWDLYYVIENAKERQEDSPFKNSLQPINEGKMIEISYQEDLISREIPDICKELSQKVWKVAEDVAAQLNDNSWRERLKVACFTVMFSTAPYHFERNAFAAPILIGESLKFLEEIYPEILIKAGGK